MPDTSTSQNTMPDPGNTASGTGGTFWDAFNTVVNGINTASNAFTNVWDSIKGPSGSLPDYNTGSGKTDTGSTGPTSNFFQQNKTVLIVLGVLVVLSVGAIYMFKKK